MMWWSHDGWGAGDWLAMSLMMVVFWWLVIALVVWLVRGSRREPQRRDSPPATTDRADEVLAERFARSEIDADEYTKRRELLHSGSDRS